MVRRVVAVPRARAISELPRVLVCRALRRRTWSPSSSNSTSEYGCNPRRFRMSWGIVTCPLEVMRVYASYR